MTEQSFDHDIDRRGFLKCMAWAGTGMIWTVAGGIPASRLLGQSQPDSSNDFTFVQISDSHIGFNKPANTDVNATFQAAIDKINGLARQPDFIIHTGDLTHLARPEEFGTLEDLLTAMRQRQLYAVPGEHDTSADDGKEYLARYGKGTLGKGWYSFDHRGVHFVGLVNVFQLEGLGRLGAEQLRWLKDDLAAVSASTPVVVFAHIPLWMVYPEWGWGTADGEQALGYLKRFGSVTVLNGHIHQTMQKTEGNVTFHTAMSTAFPQPAPGSAAAPGPMKVAANRLKSVLGIADVEFVRGRRSLAIVDSALKEAEGQA
jgi:3',5'-cyclic AMP phosphodiesterase CpdA